MWRVHSTFSKDECGSWAEVTAVPYGKGVRAGRERTKPFFTSEERSVRAWEGRLFHWE